MTFTRITVRPDQMDGVPCVRGLRIPVATVVGMVADGMSEPEITAAYRTWRLRTFARQFVTRLRPNVVEERQDCGGIEVDAGNSALATQSPRFFGGLSVFGPRFGAPPCDQLLREIAARCQVREQAAHTLRGLPTSFYF